MCQTDFLHNCEILFIHVHYSEDTSWPTFSPTFGIISLFNFIYPSRNIVVWYLLFKLHFSYDLEWRVNFIYFTYTYNPLFQHILLKRLSINLSILTFLHVTLSALKNLFS